MTEHKMEHTVQPTEGGGSHVIFGTWHTKGNRKGKNDIVGMKVTLFCHLIIDHQEYEGRFPCS